MWCPVFVNSGTPGRTFRLRNVERAVRRVTGGYLCQIVIAQFNDRDCTIKPRVLYRNSSHAATGRTKTNVWCTWGYA